MDLGDQAPLCRAGNWGLMIFVYLFKHRIFYDSVIAWFYDIVNSAFW